MGLPSNRDVVRTSNWFGSQPNSALFSDVESDEESVAEADERVEEVGSVDDVFAADSDDELDVDDDESDDELEELVSVGAANATAGVFATAAPTPSATLKPRADNVRASTGIALRG